MQIHTGEIYGKQTAQRFVMYHVLKVSKNTITLQNIDNPLSLFETTPDKLSSSGYIRISQTPFIDVQASKKKKAFKNLHAAPTHWTFWRPVLTANALHRYCRIYLPTHANHPP